MAVKGIPDDTWTTEELEQYVRKERSVFSGLERKCVEARYRIGCALLILKPRLKAERRYRKWLAEEDISITLEWETTKLAEEVKRKEDLEGLTTITEALVKYGIIRRCRRDGDAEKDNDSQALDANGDQQDDSGDQSSTLPPGTVALMLRKPKRRSNRRASKSATSKQTEESSDTTDETVASKAALPMANPTAEELEAFLTFARSVLTEDNEPEAVVSYVEACRDDTNRARYVMTAAITRIHELFLTGARVVDGVDD